MIKTKIMKKFFHDILRDKGSEKFSITKFLAFTMSTIFVAYLVFYLMILQEEVDHTLVIEMIGFISALVGMKNSWGIRKKPVSSNDIMSNQTTSQKDRIVEPKRNDDTDEVVF